MILKKKNGFTLIEVVVSIAIIGIIAIMLSGIVTSTLKARNISHERLQILAVCTSTLDEIKSKQSTFTNVSDLESFLTSNGYVKESNYYKKINTATRIDMYLYINPDLSIAGLFEIKVVGKSPNVSQISITTVIKGGE